MTHLRKMMLEELERRNYSQSTVRAYVPTIEDFAQYFKCPPYQLGPEHIRKYQAYLFGERKLDANTVNQRTGALRFFFVATLKKGWSIAETPYPRKVFRLPKILSPEQVARLIEAAPTPLCRALLMSMAKNARTTRRGTTRRSRMFNNIRCAKECSESGSWNGRFSTMDEQREGSFTDSIYPAQNRL